MLSVDILIGIAITGLLIYFALTFRAQPFDAKNSDTLNAANNTTPLGGMGATVMIILAVVCAIISVIFVVIFSTP